MPYHHLQKHRREGEKRRRAYFVVADWRRPESRRRERNLIIWIFQCSATARKKNDEQKVRKNAEHLSLTRRREKKKSPRPGSRAEGKGGGRGEVLAHDSISIVRKRKGRGKSTLIPI